MWQPAPDVGWSYWDDLGIPVEGAPAACRDGDGRLEVFAVGATQRLGHFWQLKRGDMKFWSPWEDLGPAIQSDPTVTLNADGRLEVFAIGPDGCLGHIWQLKGDEVGRWSEWDSFGHAIRSEPTLSVNGDGRLEVFAIGPDGCLGHVWQVLGSDGNTEWSNWSSFGVPLQSPPAVGETADGRLEAFAIGSDGCLGHAWQQLGADGIRDWSEWHTFGLALQSPPAVSRNADGRLEVFAIGPDGCLGHMWQTRDAEDIVHWSQWSSFGHAIRIPPTVVMNSHRGLEVFAIGPGGRLGHVLQWGPGGTTGWSDWEDLGPPISEIRPAVCENGLPDRLEPPGDVTVGTSAGVGQRASSSSPSRQETKLSADFCVIGAGPAGITVSNELLRAGASVVLVDSGGWNHEPDAQELNHAEADGPIIKDHLTYLREGRRRQVQGSAAEWGRGWCMPFRPIDFERRDWVAHSGWPVAHDELAAYEQRAAATFGFDVFPEPSLDGGLVRLSYHYPPNPLLFRALLLEQVTRPGFRLALGATAVELTISGDRIDSVRLASSDGELRVKANTIVLAAGGIENARLLLLHEHSLPAAAMVGRCFMEHPHVQSGTVSLPDVNLLRPYLDGGLTVDVFGLPDAVQREQRLLNTSVQIRPTGDALPSSGPVECQLFARSEQAPNPDSRVLLGERSDRYGCPLPYLEWRLLDEDWHSVVRTVELVAAALEERYGAVAELAIRTEKPWPWEPAGPAESDDATWGNHHLGTTRMAADPAEGVVDPNCRVHGTENLYVAGSSVFPTGSCANPTFMIVTLAHRLVDHLASATRRRPPVHASV